MRVPVIQGIIDRRILVNFHVQPEVIAKILPPPFRPQLVHGFAIAGICLIRLKNIRPRFLPVPFGIRSENAAHRIAVEWDQNGQTQSGVYVPRRDSDSLLNAWAGGTLFPGLHHRAVFDVAESREQISVGVNSRDGQVQLKVSGSVTQELPKTSVFKDLDAASNFFAQGSLGYSATSDAGRFDGIELRCANWHVEPLLVDEVTSSFFDDRTRFPTGTIGFDCALLMRGIQHEWHGREDLCCNF